MKNKKEIKVTLEQWNKALLKAYEQLSTTVQGTPTDAGIRMLISYIRGQIDALEWMLNKKS